MTASMNSHPGGGENTRRLLQMAAIKAPCRILDMGAGGGATVKLLCALGFQAEGIDLEPGEGIMHGDFTETPFADGEFDAIISECAFYKSGAAAAALKEACRLLNEQGLLLLADVCFDDDSEREALLHNSGFTQKALYDATAEWKSFYAHCLWNGTAQRCAADRPRKKCRYLLTVLQKNDTQKGHGSK